MGLKTHYGLFDRGKCVVYITGRRSVDELDSKWFGRREGGRLVLSLVETAYLMLRKQLIVECSGVEYSSLDDLMRDHYHCFKSMFWPYLTVYNDLRSRGRRVRVIGEERFLVKHKDGSLRLLVVLEEKRLVKASKLVELLDQARKNNLILVLAIVSLQGDLTYYEVTSIEPRKT